MKYSRDVHDCEPHPADRCAVSSDALIRYAHWAVGIPDFVAQHQHPSGEGEQPCAVLGRHAAVGLAYEQRVLPSDTSRAFSSINDGL
ncbi:hypothetical protein [Mycetohabitans endofungorum]|uniref:Uncharacterized protein n=1 Tax=Mycetohabitans endofungorum TaxID=417203 RepID=A0A2P5K7U7_9BURK|nr:hypothetical protein [Mycetohabitans endofungorum]PPB82782.1 hypothetical protein B0O95_11352 [Mycetohabitans endofungorum]